MKRNDLATFIVYVGMIAIAICVGIFVIKPIMDTYGSSMPINSILIMIFGILTGAILNSVFIELGHVLGAKAGHYNVIKCAIFGMGFKLENGKKKFGFMSFEGFTGETKVSPQDVKKSNLSAYILFPVLFLFVEFIVAMIVIVICKNKEADTRSIAWLHVFMIAILTVGGMFYLYDLFPARIDSVTDGYLLLLLAKPANKEAYNNLLLAEEAAFYGNPLPETPVYDELTDFTASLNLLTVYRLLSEGKPLEALPIIEKSLKEEAQVSASVTYHARSLKLNILLEQENRDKGKKFYEELDEQTKKYIADLSDLTALRSYLLIASFVEGSESESNYAIDKAEKAIKACEANYKETEKSLLQLDVDLTRSAHPSWKVYPLPWEEAEQKSE